MQDLSAIRSSVAGREPLDVVAREANVSVAKLTERALAGE